MIASDSAFGEDTAAVTAPAAKHRLPRQDQRLELDERVLGVVIGEEPRAYALTELASVGAPVHDMVGGIKADVVIDQGVAHVVGTTQPAESDATSWGAWSRAHPDTSLWRATAIAESEVTRSAQDIRVTESHHYLATIGCAVTSARLTSPNMEAPGLLVISGTIENVAASPVHHVVLRYELVDGAGKVVYRDEGLNRSAEALAAPKLSTDESVVPLAAGSNDTFRMIFLSEELPPFETARVTVARVY